MNRNNESPTSEECLQCCLCCRNFPFVPISQDDVERLEKFTGLEAAQFSNRIDQPEYSHVMEIQENGNCIFLKKSGNRFHCSVYQARPVVCQNYPSDKKQQETCLKNREKSQITSK